MLSVVMFIVLFLYFRAKCRYAECHYVECHYVECHSPTFTDKANSVSRVGSTLRLGRNYPAISNGLAYYL